MKKPLIDSYETYYAKRRPIVTVSAIEHDDAQEIASLFTNSVRTTANNVRNLRIETLSND